MVRFTQFGQDASRAVGVQERNAHPVGPGAWYAINHANPLALVSRNLDFKRIDGIGQMVQTLTAFDQERLDGARVAGGFEQLHEGSSHTEEGDPHSLIGNLFHPLEIGPQDRFIEDTLGLDGANCDPDMVQRPDG